MLGPDSVVGHDKIIVTKDDLKETIKNVPRQLEFMGVVFIRGLDYYNISKLSGIMQSVQIRNQPSSLFENKDLSKHQQAKPDYYFAMVYASHTYTHPFVVYDIRHSSKPDTTLHRELI